MLSPVPHPPVAVLPVLLRLALCLCLLLDAMAPTLAALRPQAAHHAPVPAMADATAPVADDCHLRAEPAPRPRMPAPAADDCLQHCLDVCLQQGHALTRTAPALSPAGARQAPPDLVQAAPPPARPFPPLRPPIA